MAQELVTALFDRWAGTPIVVIGGGPSVLEDLPKMPCVPACVISANTHGVHQNSFKVDIFINMDCQHCLLKVPMETLIRPAATKAGAVVVNKFTWADYRLGDFSFTGNTGLSAIVLAAALGGDPVIPVGIDFWSGGRRYFHDDPSTAKPKKTAPLGRIARRSIRQLLDAVKGANIRPISGPLLEYFPAFGTPLAPRRDTSYRTYMLKQSTQYVHVAREFSLHNRDRAKAGTTLALTRKEAVRPRGGVISKL